MNDINITILDKDKGSIPRLEKLLRGYMCTYEKLETKDGTVYSIEFKTGIIRDKFLNDWSS